MSSRLPPTLICGAVRNGGAAFKATLDMIERLKPAFEDCSVAIVTNDNTDDTDATLSGWSASNSKHKALHVDGFAYAYPERIDRLAAVRNFYLKHLYDQPAGTFEMLLVLDLDGPNAMLEPGPFLTAIDSVKSPWDGLFANQLAAYYDIYPLRHDIWSPDDCWVHVVRAGRGLFTHRRKKHAFRKYISGRQVQISPSEAPIRVRSAFGGLGLYRVKSLTNNKWYGSRLADGTPVCDHVIVNTAIDKQGGKLFIVPSLLNIAPPEHLSRGSGQPPRPGLFGR